MRPNSDPRSWVSLPLRVPVLQRGGAGHLIRVPLITLWLIATPLTAGAQPIAYDCIAKRTNYPNFSAYDSLIQPRIQFVIDGPNTTVTDPLIERLAGGPIPAELTENTEKKFVVKWSFFVRGRWLSQSRTEFRAAFLKLRNELIITQTVLSSNGVRFHARGACNWDRSLG